MANSFDVSTYIDTQQRIVRFWDEYPTGAIRTNLMSDPSDFTICRYVAKIYKDHLDAEPAATGWAFEIAGKGMANQTSHEENCETSAIGRGLANLGYATKGEDRPSRQEMEKVQRGNGEAYRSPNPARPEKEPRYTKAGKIDARTVPYQGIDALRSDAAPSLYPPRDPAGTPAPTAITSKADKTITPMQKLHGLAELRGLKGEGKNVHTPLRCVCQYILPTVPAKDGSGYVALTSMTQLTDANLEYLYKQIEDADEQALMLMAVDYPAAIAAATTLEELGRIAADLSSIGARNHTHPELLKMWKERKDSLSPKSSADVAA